MYHLSLLILPQSGESFILIFTLDRSPPNVLKYYSSPLSPLSPYPITHPTSLLPSYDEPKSPVSFPPHRQNNRIGMDQRGGMRSRSVDLGVVYLLHIDREGRERGSGLQTGGQRCSWIMIYDKKVDDLHCIRLPILLLLDPRKAFQGIHSMSPYPSLKSLRIGR